MMAKILVYELKMLELMLQERELRERLELGGWLVAGHAICLQNVVDRQRQLDWLLACSAAMIH